MSCNHNWGPMIYSYRIGQDNMICYCFKNDSDKNQQTRFCIECGQVEHFCDNIWSVSRSRFDKNKINQVLIESAINETI